MKYVTGEPLEFDIKLPSALTGILDQKREGLILVTGKPGSGYTGTLNGIISYINRTQEMKIILMEDKPQIIHEDEKSEFFTGISSREEDKGIVKAIRMRPDIIIIDNVIPETLSQVMFAADTGHLVIALMPSYVSANDLLDEIVRSKPDSLDLKHLTSIWNSVNPTIIHHNNLVLNENVYYPMVEITENNETLQTLQQAVEELVGNGVVSPEKAAYYANEIENLR